MNEQDHAAAIKRLQGYRDNIDDQIAYHQQQVTRLTLGYQKSATGAMEPCSVDIRIDPPYDR